MRTTLAYLLLSALIVNAAQMEDVVDTEIDGIVDTEIDATNVVFSEQENVAEPTPVVAQVVVIDKDDVLSIAADMAIAAALAANKETAGRDPLVEGTAETPVPREQDFEQIVEMEQPDSVVADNVAGTIAQKEIAEEEIFMQQALVSSHKPSLVVTESVFTFSPITLAPESSRSAHRDMPSQLALPRITTPPVVAKVSKSNANSIWLTNGWEVIVPVLVCLLGQY